MVIVFNLVDKHAKKAIPFLRVRLLWNTKMSFFCTVFVTHNNRRYFAPWRFFNASCMRPNHRYMYVLDCIFSRHVFWAYVRIIYGYFSIVPCTNFPRKISPFTCKLISMLFSRLKWVMVQINSNQVKLCEQKSCCQSRTAYIEATQIKQLHARLVWHSGAICYKYVIIITLQIICAYCCICSMCQVDAKRIGCK